MAECRLMDGAGSIGSEATGLLGCAALAAELGDLKRIHDARSPDSLAVQAFRTAWGRLVSGEPVRDVALSVTADAIAAMRLGAIDLPMLQSAGVADANVILLRGFDAIAGAISPALRANLRRCVGLPMPVWAAAPAFAEALIRQPRAGATCPGKPRLILEPPESHGDHCLVVAVLGVVLSGFYGADPSAVFVAGLAHHLHNAVLPDSGFAGEVLLGDALAPLMERLFAQAIDTLPAAPAATVRNALAVIGDADTAEGRAFHAADVIDRVLQMRHYDRVAAFTTSQALDDLELVHAGPVQAFHQAVLAEAGLP